MPVANFSGRLVARTAEGNSDKHQLFGGWGFLEISNKEGNEVTKNAHVAVPHYLTAEEPTLLFQVNSLENIAPISIGGGTGIANACTAVEIFCAANTITRTGTKVAEFIVDRLRLHATTFLEMAAAFSTDTEPSDDTSFKKFTIQRRSSAPSNAAYIKFTNSPGAPTNEFYLVMEEGA